LREKEMERCRERGGREVIGGRASLVVEVFGLRMVLGVILYSTDEY